MREALRGALLSVLFLRTVDLRHAGIGAGTERAAGCGARGSPDRGREVRAPSVVGM